MDRLLQDLRSALRTLRKQPVLNTAVVISLALGIGLNTAVFSLVNALLLRKPQMLHSEQLVEVYTNASRDFLYATSSYLDFVDLRRQNRVFSALVAYNPMIANYQAGERTELLYGEIVSGDYFSMLGIPLVLGRSFVPEEDRAPGSHPVVLLGQDLWQRRFGADRRVLGKTLRLNGIPFTVVGVVARQYRGAFPGLAADLWVPMMMQGAINLSSSGLTDRAQRWFFVKGRLKPGVSLAQAQAEMNVLAGRLAREYPATNKDKRLTLVRSRDVALNPGADGALVGVAMLLLTVVGLVLLLACTNIVNLLLARGTARYREMAVRVALGAGRGRLVRQLVAETLLLTLLGGACGLLLAYWSMRLLTVARPSLPVPIPLDLGLDGRVVGFALVISVLAGVLSGLAPARWATRVDLVRGLKEETAALGTSPRRFGLRNLLVIGQVAVSFLLLILSGLFIRSLQKAGAADPGFTARQAALMTLYPGLAGYSDARTELFFEQATERLRALPGVEDVTVADRIPMGFGFKVKEVVVQGRPPEPEGQRPQVDYGVVGVDYFRTLGVSLAAGRDFRAQDDLKAPRVAIVNETMARQLWPDGSALGQNLSIAGPGGPYREVVAVVKDSKYRSLSESPRPYLYLPFRQEPQPGASLIVRTRGDARTLLSAVRSEVAAVGPEVPAVEVKTLEQHLAASLFPVRMGAAVLGLFGTLGLALATVGLYGLIAYTVGQRTRELGTRMALGAQARDLLFMVIRQGMTLAVFGMVVGLVAALACTRLVSGLLIGVRASDPVSFLGVALLLFCVTLAACLLPAVRASRVNPLIALKWM